MSKKDTEKPSKNTDQPKKSAEKKSFKKKKDKKFFKKSSEKKPFKKGTEKKPFRKEKDEKKNVNNWTYYAKVLQKYLSTRNYIPMNAEELIERLDIPQNHKNQFLLSLKKLQDNQEVSKVDGKFELWKPAENIIKGTIQLHKRGFGFVSPSRGEDCDQDVFIPKHCTKNAVDGDLVEVLIDEKEKEKEGLGPEGRIISVLERSRKHLAGVVTFVSSESKAHVYSPLLGKDNQAKVMSTQQDPLTMGDRIVVCVTHWGEEGGETTADLVYKIGNIKDPSIDVKAAIEEFEIRSDFPSAVLEEVKPLGKRVKTSEMKGRKDLRKQQVITIDPLTARDFDDALSVKRNGKGFDLWVHIADVTHYVKPGSQINEEAKERCNSTYFPGICVPMIPKELSCELCSLKPKVNRLAVTVEMHFNEEGEMQDYEIYRSVIHSQHRFTYESAKEVLDGKRRSTHAPMLKDMLALCGLLKKQRAKRGSIEFALSEVCVLVDDQGVPQGLQRSEYDETHQLVEEFMVKTNETIATHLTKENKPVPYRIHDQPSAESIKNFVRIARGFGYNVKNNPEIDDFKQLFEDAKGTSNETLIAVSFIRSMRLACYSVGNLGHFGLSLEYYCHFTSPIRRYADLVVHRVLFEEAASEEERMTEEELHLITEQCSKQERLSAKAEGNVILLKKLRLLKSYQDDSDKKASFDAIVTQVKPHGIIFDIPELVLDGFIHISELGNDYFVYNESTKSLVGDRSNEQFRLGEHIKVNLAKVDLIGLESSWEMLLHKRKKKRKKRR
jgi:ribonuclease R